MHWIEYEHDDQPTAQLRVSSISDDVFMIIYGIFTQGIIQSKNASRTKGGQNKKEITVQFVVECN